MIYKPYDYQQRATRWVADHPRCCLFLDMGLGKTVSTLTAVVELIDALDVERVLVVAPKKVAESTWSDECKKWAHLSCLRVSRVIGTPRQRLAALDAVADVYVVGRDSLVWLLGEMKGRVLFDMLVLDELTSFKNSKSLRFKAARRLSANAHRVVGLTGTPAPNGLLDLWAQMYCVDQGARLGKSKTRYRDTYFHVVEHNHIPIRCDLKQGADAVIRGKIADICLTMQAKDYLSLPTMTEHTVYIDLPPSVLRRYSAFEREQVLDFIDRHTGEHDALLAGSALALMSKLGQMANGSVYTADGEAVAVHDEKAERLAEIVEAAGSPVLVFYQYKFDAVRICERLQGLRVRVYAGDADLRDWNAGRIDVLLAHPASTAFGLNMQQGGHYIVWFGLGWNLELYQQANARLHRQGQTKPVQVFRLVCRGTVDERALSAMSRKGSVQGALLDALSELAGNLETS